MASPRIGSRYVSVRRHDRDLVLTLELTHDLTLGSPRRERKALGMLKRLLRKASTASLLCSGRTITASLHGGSGKDLRDLLLRIDAAIDSFRAEKLHPKEVEEVLGITALERIRWTKDGRIPQSGTGSFGVGQRSIRFPLHPGDGIAALAGRAGIVEEWRAIDAETRSHVSSKPER
jgi:hypothetical protein